MGSAASFESKCSRRIRQRDGLSSDVAQSPEVEMSLEPSKSRERSSVQSTLLFAISLVAKDGSRVEQGSWPIRDLLCYSIPFRRGWMLKFRPDGYYLLYELWKAAISRRCPLAKESGGTKEIGVYQPTSIGESAAADF
jgi:hypothetical protein